MRLLVIDDDVKLCRLIRGYLTPLGYSVEAVHTGPAGLERALAEPFAAIILDVMLPGMDGVEVLRRLRAKSTVPVLMLTGRGEEPDRIAGLEMGADDYLPKTFSTRELLARLRAVIRRAQMPRSSSQAGGSAAAAGAVEIVEVGDLRIDPGARGARLGSQPLTLTPVEFDLLLSLARGAGRVKTREQLILDAGDRDGDVFDRTIDVHISALRRKLGDDARSPKWIVTVRSAGYMMRKPGAETEWE